jgi:hypothetical protein
MKKLIKLWDLLLVALLGMMGTGCNIIEPPPAEYGPEPEYGPIYYSIGTVDNVTEDTNEIED